MLLVNFLFWTGLAQGVVVWSAIFRTAQATWAAGVNRLGQAAVGFLPFSIGMFALLYAGREHWLTWLHNEEIARGWLNPTFFFARNLAGLLLITIVSYAFVMQYRSGEGSAADDVQDAAQGGLNKTAIVLVLLYVAVYSMFAFDLVMSLEAHWMSTLFGALFFIGNLYMSVAGLIILATVLRKPLGLERFIGPREFRDLGNLLMGFGIFFTGLIFAQWLTIWYGNIPEEVAYLAPRIKFGPWNVVSLVFLMCGCVLPFLLLQSDAAKAHPRRLCGIALLVFVGIWLERWLLVVPAVSRMKLAGYTPLAWAIPLLCAGVLVLVVTSSLRRYPHVSSLDLALTID